MRVSVAFLAASLAAAGCAEAPVPVFHPGIDKPRISRINFRPEGKTLRSTNFILGPNLLSMGLPAEVMLYTPTEIHIKLDGREYIMVPSEGQRFPTAPKAIDTFLDKYFVDSAHPVDVDSLGPPEYKKKLMEGVQVRGMTKEQVYACLGPPWKVGDNRSAMQLSRQEILANDHWVYTEKWLLVAPELVDLYFGDGRLQKQQ